MLSGSNGSRFRGPVDTRPTEDLRSVGTFMGLNKTDCRRPAGNPPSRSHSQRLAIPALTGFRFIAAFMVLLGHGYPVLQFGDSRLIGNILGPLAANAMAMFFVLSGFVIWLNYAEDFTRGPFRVAVWRFGVARFARLYPLYACVLIIAFLAANWHILAAAFPRDLLFLPLAQGWIPAAGTKPLIFTFWSVAHTWSISAEVLFYLLFPVIVLPMDRLKRNGVLIFCGILTTSFAAMMYAFYRWPLTFVAPFAPTLSIGAAAWWVTYYAPYVHIFEFVAGAAAAKLFLDARRQAIRWRPTVRHRALAIIAVSAQLVMIGTFSLGFPHLYSTVQTIQRTIPLLTIPYFLWYICHYDGWLRRSLSWRPFVAGGEISYSLYLLHPFILSYFVRGWVASLTPWTFLEWLALMVGALSTITVFSRGTYLTIEVPARRTLRRWLTRRIVASTA